jgi:hypothetical protein
MSMLSLWVDESDRGSLLAVGGLLIKWDIVLKIIHGWRAMKKNLGLDQSAEVKWNLPKDHETRKNLESSGKKTRGLAEEAINYLSSLDEATLIVSVMLEQRKKELWKKFFNKVSVRDFYCEGFRFLLQRAAEEVKETSSSGCIVVCDTPELGKVSFEFRKLRRGKKAVEKEYSKWFMEQGVDVGPSRLHHKGALKDAGFHPSFLIGDATYHDMLQMADIIVGAISDWVNSIRVDQPDQWMINQVKKLSSKFRAKHGQPSFWGDGLILWPSQNELWDKLKRSLS